MSSRDVLKRVLSKTVNLPTLPSILENLNRMMANPRTSAKEVANLIGNDPALTVKILKVVNSSFYGVTNRVTTVNHAVVILGFNTIRSIVLSTSIFDSLVKGAANTGGFNRVEFWRHSVAVGCAAKALARHIGDANSDDAFVGGLLHDIGKVVLDQHMHEDFEKVIETVRRENILMLEAEDKVLGISHAEIGGLLLEKWAISPKLTGGIEYHHQPAEAGDHATLACVIHVADILARAMRVGNGGDGKIPTLVPFAMERLSIRAEHFDKLLEETERELLAATPFMEFIQ